MSPPVRHPGEMRWETRLLTVTTLTLLVIGLVSTYSATNVLPRDGQPPIGFAFALKQIAGIGIGAALLVVASRVDYYRWRNVAWPLILATLVLLLIPVVPGTHAIAKLHNGARRWIEIGPVNFQPSEVARFAIVVWCAMLASKKGAQVREIKKGILPFVIVFGALFLLILLEPNLSMAVLVALLGGIVLFSAGAKIGHFIVLGAIGALVAYNRITHVGFRQSRVTTFLTGGSAGDDASYQIHNSLVGIGSGRVFGVGFGQGQQKLGYLPYSTSDFLFSAIGEEWGFLGVCVVIALYSVFCWLGFRIARTASDPFGQYLAVGFTATVGVTAIMHMAVTLSMMPATGLPLPFMSYGRSSLVLSMLGTGILLNIGRLRGRRVPEPKSAAAR